MVNEEWKHIEGFESYQISSLGRLKNKDGQVLNPPPNKKGYIYTVLSHDGKKKTIAIHRAVAGAFIPNPVDKQQVNHKDLNKSNNCVENLEWCTNSENNKHSWDSRCRKDITGQNNPNARWSESDIQSIRKLLETHKNKEVANIYGTSQNIISRIKHRRIWAHI